MTSNVFSKLYPTTQGRSYYESLRRREGDPEDRTGLLDEENLRHEFGDEDLEHAEGLGVEDSRATLPASGRGGGRSNRGNPRGGRPGWAPPEDDGDNDVPASLLVERHHDTRATGGPSSRARTNKRGKQPAAVPGPSSKSRSQHWGMAQARHKPQGGDALPSSLFTGLVSGSAKKKAEWRWANASNLDYFMKSVYHYYIGHGIWCILLDRVLQLMYVACWSTPLELDRITSVDADGSAVTLLFWPSS
jgi:autophagy-related protein 9